MPPTGDKVHCYCNSPRCVGYSYMCVSEYGCFSQVTTDSSYSRGCVEDLVMIERCLQAEEETFKRLNKSLIKADQTLDIGVQLLSCCYDDMCNYANYEQEEQRSTINGNRGKFSNINMIVLTLYFNQNAIIDMLWSCGRTLWTALFMNVIFHVINTWPCSEALINLLYSPARSGIACMYGKIFFILSTKSFFLK